jgi:hypothetical protein
VDVSTSLITTFVSTSSMIGAPIESIQATVTVGLVVSSASPAVVIVGLVEYRTVAILEPAAEKVNVSVFDPAADVTVPVLEVPPLTWTASRKATAGIAPKVSVAAASPVKRVCWDLVTSFAVWFR